VEMVPFPSFREPFQTAEALRIIFAFLLCDWTSKPLNLDKSVQHAN
jgi:hypothetical protein